MLDNFNVHFDNMMNRYYSTIVALKPEQLMLLTAGALIASFCIGFLVAKTARR